MAAAGVRVPRRPPKEVVVIQETYPALDIARGLAALVLIFWSLWDNNNV